MTDYEFEELREEHAHDDELVELALTLSDPRDAEDVVLLLDRHADRVRPLLDRKSRWRAFAPRDPTEMVLGPLGLVGIPGMGGLVIASFVMWLVHISFPAFIAIALAGFAVLRVAAFKTAPSWRPDRIADEAERPMAAGVLAAWYVARAGENAPRAYDELLLEGLGDCSDYWHDLAVLAVGRLPSRRREAVLRSALELGQPPWHLLMAHPDRSLVETALTRRPESTQSVGFHALRTLAEHDVAPFVETWRNGERDDVVVGAIAASHDASAAPVLVEEIVDGREDDAVIEGLARLGDRAVAAIAGAFSDATDAAARLRLVGVLRRMPPTGHVEAFARERLRLETDATVAAILRRIILTARFEDGWVEALEEIPAPDVDVPGLELFDGTRLSNRATAALAAILTTEAHDVHAPELPAIRESTAADARRRFVAELDAPIGAMIFGRESALLPLAEPRDDEPYPVEQSRVDVLARYRSPVAWSCLDHRARTTGSEPLRAAAYRALQSEASRAGVPLDRFVDRAVAPLLAGELDEVGREIRRHQHLRLEAAMLAARRWDEDSFRELFPTQSGMTILWGTYDGAGRFRDGFRVDEDFTLVGPDDERFHVPPGAEIGVVHPAELTKTDAARWNTVFADYELVPEFEQLNRPRFRPPTDPDRVLYAAFEPAEPPGFCDALQRNGWSAAARDRDVAFTWLKPFRRGTDAVTAAIELDPGISVDAPEPQTIECLVFWEGYHRVMPHMVEQTPLVEVDPVLFSEVVYELHRIVAG